MFNIILGGNFIKVVFFGIVSFVNNLYNVFKFFSSFVKLRDGYIDILLYLPHFI